MPKTEVKLIKDDKYSLGKHPRVYDGLNDADIQQRKVIDEVLAWKDEDLPDYAEPELNPDGHLVPDLIVNDFLDNAGLKELEEADEIKALHPGLKAAEKSKGIFKTLWYSFRDLFKSRRVRTSLTNIGCIVLGATAGAAIGTFVLPVIGTAIGGTIGAAVGAIGAIGGAILGAFAGSWAAKKISKKFYSRENNYDISVEQTTLLRETFSIHTETVNHISSYLYNRELASTNKRCKRYYREIRESGIQRCSSKGMEKIARFFCHELELLEEMRATNKHSKSYQRDVLGVIKILNAICISDKGFAPETQLKVGAAVAEYRKREREHKSPRGRFPVLRARFPDEFPRRALPKKKGNIHRVHKRIVENVGGHFTISEKTQPGKPTSYSYRLKQGERALKLQLEEGSESPQCVVPQDKITRENREDYAKGLVQVAVAAGSQKPTVLAGRDAKLAVYIYAECLKQGLEPTLGEPEQFKSPEAIILAAHKRAGVPFVEKDDAATDTPSRRPTL